MVFNSMNNQITSKYGILTFEKDLIPVGRFTRDQLITMIAGTKKHLRYNTQGQLAKEDEKALTLKQLERFVRDIDFGGKNALYV